MKKRKRYTAKQKATIVLEIMREEKSIYQLDNAFTERLWRSVKYEEVYLKNYQTPKEARNGLTGYFEFYNYQRLHQALAYQTPAEVYHASKNAVQLSQLEMEDSTLFWYHYVFKNGVHLRKEGVLVSNLSLRQP